MRREQGINPARELIPEYGNNSQPSWECHCENAVERILFLAMAWLPRFDNEEVLVLCR